MKFIVLVKASADSEAGILPTEEQIVAMGKFNEELVDAGVMLAGEGLQPSSKGFRVNFSGGKAAITDGPFAETKELVAGFWIWEVKSREEAAEWIKRAPFNDGDTIELRQIQTAEDFAGISPEIIERETALRARTEG